MPEATKPATKSVWDQNATPRHRIQWCPGCGDYGVLNALKAALTALELTPSEVLLVGGIGCSGQIRNYLNGNSFYGTHGGALAYALGAKMANPDLTVFVLAGDGDTLAIGVENFVHICRRDPDVTLVIMDNGVYGLTKGQASPSWGLGQPGVRFSEESPPFLDPLKLALASGATFIAQSFSGDPKHAAEMIVEPVPPDHDPGSEEAAWDLLRDFDRRGKLPLGVIYRHPREKAPARRLPMWPEELSQVDIEPILQGFR